MDGWTEKIRVTWDRLTKFTKLFRVGYVIGYKVYDTDDLPMSSMDEGLVLVLV